MMTVIEFEKVTDVETLIKAIEQISTHALFQEPAKEAATEPMAEQYFLLAIAALDTACSNLRICDLHLTRNRKAG